MGRHLVIALDPRWGEQKAAMGRQVELQLATRPEALALAPGRPVSEATPVEPQVVPG